MALIIPFITQGLYNGIIETIGSIAINCCSMVRSIYTHKHIDVNKHLKELDIEHRLKLIELVLRKKAPLVDGPINDPVELALFDLYRSVQEVHSNLRDLERKIAYHRMKWFNSWRTLNIKSNIAILKVNVGILNNRFEDLINVSRLMN